MRAGFAFGDFSMGQWVKESEYCLTHPSGWTIAKCIVNGIPQYILWHGDARKGQFDEARKAMSEHTRLVPVEQDIQENKA